MDDFTSLHHTLLTPRSLCDFTSHRVNWTWLSLMPPATALTDGYSPPGSFYKSKPTWESTPLLPVWSLEFLSSNAVISPRLQLWDSPTFDLLLLPRGRSVPEALREGELDLLACCLTGGESRCSDLSSLATKKGGEFSHVFIKKCAKDCRYYFTFRQESTLIRKPSEVQRFPVLLVKLQLLSSLKTNLCGGLSSVLWLGLSLSLPAGGMSLLKAADREAPPLWLPSWTLGSSLKLWSLNRGRNISFFRVQ